MLDDTSRKVLRVLFSNYFFHEFELELDYVVRRSLRSEESVKAAISDLILQRYLQWDKHKNLYKVMHFNG